MNLSIPRALLVIFAYALSDAAQACVFPPSVEEKFKKSDAVFVGTAVECDAKKNQLIFDVHGVWKGGNRPLQMIGVRKCPYIELGQEYLVYAAMDSGQLRLLDDITFCPGGVLPVVVKQSEEMVADKDLEELGSPKYIKHD